MMAVEEEDKGKATASDCNISGAALPNFPDSMSPSMDSFSYKDVLLVVG